MDEARTKGPGSRFAENDWDLHCGKKKKYRHVSHHADRVHVHIKVEVHNSSTAVSNILTHNLVTQKGRHAQPTSTLQAILLFLYSRHDGVPLVRQPFRPELQQLVLGYAADAAPLDSRHERVLAAQQPGATTPASSVFQPLGVRLFRLSHFRFSHPYDIAWQMFRRFRRYISRSERSLEDETKVDLLYGLRYVRVRRGICTEKRGAGDSDICVLARHMKLGATCDMILLWSVGSCLSGG